MGPVGVTVVVIVVGEPAAVSVSWRAEIMTVTVVPGTTVLVPEVSSVAPVMVIVSVVTIPVGGMSGKVGVAKVGALDLPEPVSDNLELETRELEVDCKELEADVLAD